MPITMMFAARQIGARYRSYVTGHRVMVEAQLRTSERSGSTMSPGYPDPAREAFDLGGAVQFFDDQPPALVESGALLAGKKRLAGLKPPDPLGGGRMTDRVEAMRLLKERAGAEKIVEGWIEGPCGQASNLRGINTLMLDFTDDPAFVDDLLDFVVEMETAFARAQIQAGADLIGMGDPASSLVGPARYRRFIQPRQRELIRRIHEMGALCRLHICGNTRRIMRDLGTVGADILDVDSVVDMAGAREDAGPSQVLLGGIDPVRTLAMGAPEEVRRKARECHRSAGARYIVGGGCEVPPETPAANVDALSDYVLEERH